MCGQTLLLFIVIANCAIPVSVSTWRRTGHASQLWYAYLRADGLGKTKRPVSTPVEYGHLYLFHFLRRCSSRGNYRCIRHNRSLLPMIVYQYMMVYDVLTDGGTTGVGSSTQKRAMSSFCCSDTVGWGTGREYGLQ